MAFVMTPTSQRALFSMAVALNQRRACLLEGPPGNVTTVFDRVWQ